MGHSHSNNTLFAEITRSIVGEFDAVVEEFLAGDIPSEVGPLPHHLICTTPTMSDAVTDLTVHLWEDFARVVVFRDWKSDTALVGTVGYGPDFGDNLRALIQEVEQRLRTIPDPQQAIESLVLE